MMISRSYGWTWNVSRYRRSFSDHRWLASIKPALLNRFTILLNNSLNVNRNDRSSRILPVSFLDIRASLYNNILLTGGNCHFRNFKERLSVEFCSSRSLLFSCPFLGKMNFALWSKMIIPFEWHYPKSKYRRYSLKVFPCYDLCILSSPSTYALRGGVKLSQSSEYAKYCVTKREYEEQGEAICHQKFTDNATETWAMYGCISRSINAVRCIGKTRSSRLNEILNQAESSLLREDHAWWNRECLTQLMTYKAEDWSKSPSFRLISFRFLFFILFDSKQVCKMAVLLVMMKTRITSLSRWTCTISIGNGLDL